MSTTNNENEHLLQHTWVLWFRPPTAHTNAAPQAKAWETSQKKSFVAASVEEFWRGFHNLPRITPAHPVNCDYSLFKEGVKPMWEDEFNQQGGRWTYTIERRQSSVPSTSMPGLIEQVWLDVMLCLIGEGFEPHGDKIAGGVCGIRMAKGKTPSEMSAKIHIWTKDATNVEANTKIGEVLKGVLHAADGQLTYSPHDSQPSRGRGSYNHGNLKL